MQVEEAIVQAKKNVAELERQVSVNNKAIYMPSQEKTNLGEYTVLNSNSKISHALFACYDDSFNPVLFSGYYDEFCLFVSVAVKRNQGSETL